MRVPRTPAVRTSIVAALLALPALLAAQAADTVPLALPNDNRTPAGTRHGRTIAVTMEPRLAHWRPAGDSLLDFRIVAFAEAGRAPQVPGPLLRARVGDTLQVTLRNPTDRDLLVVGLADRGRGSAVGDTVTVPSGEARELSIRLTTPGVFWYDAITRRADDPTPPRGPLPEKPRRADLPLVGGFVVDAADAPADVAAKDRIFIVHSGWDLETLAREAARRVRVPATRLNINGASWPNTERLEYAVGDTVRWHIVNASFLPHPLHLHGFYFRVDGRGDFAQDTTYGRAARRMAVTELVQGFTTASLTWVPERPGNWLFHCHLLQHMSPLAGLLPDTASDAHAAHGAMHDPREHMAGMVMGIHIRGREARQAATTTAARRLDLFAQSRDSALGGDLRAYGFVLARADAPPALDSVRRPGTPIVLARGEPVAITVHNRLSKPLAVHWHGMELESRYDGVGGWSGTIGAVTPAIAPGDTFVARFTPRHAGTFIYHTHDESDNELNAGLYGPLLVLEPGERRDTTRDHVLVLASGAERRPRGIALLVGRPHAAPVVNGDSVPHPIVLAAGANRLRIIHISDSDVKRLRLVDSTGALLPWRVLAKDGWTRPAAQRAPRDAEMWIGVGETYDVELDASALARRGPVWLEVVTSFYPGYKLTFTHTARVPLVVAPASRRVAARR